MTIRDFFAMARTCTMMGGLFRFWRTKVEDVEEEVFADINFTSRD